MTLSKYKTLGSGILLYGFLVLTTILFCGCSSSTKKINICGNTLCENTTLYTENATTCPSDCVSCDDGLSYTIDSFNYTAQTCTNLKAVKKIVLNVSQATCGSRFMDRADTSTLSKIWEYNRSCTEEVLSDDNTYALINPQESVLGRAVGEFYFVLPPEVNEKKMVNVYASTEILCSGSLDIETLDKQGAWVSAQPQSKLLCSENLFEKRRLTISPQVGFNRIGIRLSGKDLKSEAKIDFIIIEVEYLPSDS
ncbi:hypothetical protein COY95_02495 [Candidatus Woesearchaeota archaeon CG_4_10_14_0_8_um_filter_47_5]|nr:MAG: hypothetical protein COY95_02495 [Candidatus Woesearchaeota archaeon CG_4_10_14_0_8_um_filter_47_5]